MNFFSPELSHELFTISDNHYTNSNSNCSTWISNTTFQNHSASADGNIPDDSASSCGPLMTSLHLLIKPCMSIYIWKYILFRCKWLFLLKCNCFTMLCYFLLNKVNQLYVYPLFFLDFLPFSLPFLFKHSFPHVHPLTIYCFLSYVFELYKNCYVVCSFLKLYTLLAIIIQHSLPKQHNVLARISTLFSTADKLFNIFRS